MKLFIPIVLLVLIKITYSERTLEDQNREEIEPSLNIENDDNNYVKEPSKRTIGLKNPGFAKHVAINSLGHKHVFGYGPVDYKYVPVIKPIVLKPVTHSNLLKPVIKPVRLRPVSHYLPIKPVRRPIGSNGWKPVVPPNVPLPSKYPHKPWQNSWDNKRPSISLQPPVAGSGQHGVQVNPDLDVRPSGPEIVPLEPTPQIPIQPSHPLAAVNPIVPTNPVLPDQPEIHHIHPVFPQPVFPQSLFPHPVFPTQDHVHPQPIFPPPIQHHPVFPPPIQHHPVFPQPVFPQPLHPQPVFPQPLHPQPVFPHPIAPEPVQPIFPISPSLVHVTRPELPVLPLGAAFNPEILHTKAVLPQHPLPVHPYLPPHGLNPHGAFTPGFPQPSVHPISIVPPPALGPGVPAGHPLGPGVLGGHPSIIPASGIIPGSTFIPGHPGILPAAPAVPIHPTIVHSAINPAHPAFVPAQPGVIPAPPESLHPSAVGPALTPVNYPHNINPPSIIVDQPPFISGQPSAVGPHINNGFPATHIQPIPNNPVHFPNYPVDVANHNIGVSNFPDQPNHPVHPIHALQPQPNLPDHNFAQPSGGLPEPYPLPTPSGVEFHGKAAHLIPLSNPSFNTLPNPHNNPPEVHNNINPGIQSPQEPFNYHAKEHIPQGHFIQGIHHIPQNNLNTDIQQVHNGLLPSTDVNDLSVNAQHQFTIQHDLQDQQPGISIQPGQTDIQVPFQLPSHPTFRQSDVNIFQQNPLNDGTSHDIVGPTDGTLNGYVK